MGEIYLQYEYWIAAIQLILAMLGMGATLTTDDFKSVLHEPMAFSIGTLIQVLLVPITAYIFIKTLGLEGGVAVGIALIAAIPGGTTSNIFTYMAKGNIPLSISITGVTTLACLITTPLILGLLITEYLPPEFTMPTEQIISEIALSLLLPLFMGMMILKLTPNNAKWISQWSIRISLLFIVFIVIGSASAGRLDIDAFGRSNVWVVFIFIIALTFISLISVKLLKLSAQDNTAIQMEVVVRNINLGVLIKASMFPVIVGTAASIGDMVLFTILLYGAIQMLIAAVIITVRRRIQTN